jgi:hypothetical protein
MLLVQPPPTLWYVPHLESSNRMSCIISAIWALHHLASPPIFIPLLDPILPNALPTQPDATMGLVLLLRPLPQYNATLSLLPSSMLPLIPAWLLRISHLVMRLLGCLGLLLLLH